MTIYDIDQAIMSCIDDETGEIIDLEKLMELNMEREQKVENVACWIVDLQAEAAAIKAQEQTLKDRREKAEKKLERLKAFLADVLQGEKFRSARVSVGWRKSVSVEISDEGSIPDEYVAVKTARQPDKAAIKAAITEGREVPGCQLVERMSAQIK